MKNNKKRHNRKSRLKPRRKKTHQQLPTAYEMRCKARISLIERLSDAVWDDELFNLLLDMAKEM